MAKRKARISDETFDEFLAPQRILGACEQRAIKEIIVEQLAEAIVVPRTPIHPGEHLAEELRELGITAAELSRQINVPVTGSPVSFTASAASRPTRRCGLDTGSARARNSR